MKTVYGCCNAATSSIEVLTRRGDIDFGLSWIMQLSGPVVFNIMLLIIIPIILSNVDPSVYYNPTLKGGFTLSLMILSGESLLTKGRTAD